MADQSPILGLLNQLRAQRRQTITALRDLGEERLTAHVGPERPTDVRATLLALAQDDDLRGVLLARILAAEAWQPTEARLIIAAMARTRGELRGLLVPVDDETLEQTPAPGEWAVRQALLHLMNNEERLVEDMGYAIMRLHSGQQFAVHHPTGNRAAGTVGPDVSGGVDAVRDRMEHIRTALVTSAASLSDAELSAPTVWAGAQVDLRYMLHRRASHERQHMVQIAKTLQAIGCIPSEAALLLAEAEKARGTLDGMLVALPDAVVQRDPGNTLPSIAALVTNAVAEEAARCDAIIAAM